MERLIYMAQGAGWLLLFQLVCATLFIVWNLTDTENPD